ncbi:MAG TPA: chemotaxis protein CheW [Bryobacteraceae bacterium]|jgi:purine-binding chemotaxis protein CheW|nr:chemotaxis protein CheW [Bryobacteraceae bacterium]
MQAIETAPSQISYTADLQQYLSFALGDEQYGIEILRVQEIKGYSGITPIPNTPAHIRGVMNLRGTVIPVVDLRARFNLETRAYDKFTVIIVVTVGARIIGLVVDAVSDVLDISRTDIRPAPELGHRQDMHFISGMVHVGERLVVLLDIATLLAEDSLAAAVAPPALNE